MNHRPSHLDSRRRMTNGISPMKWTLRAQCQSGKSTIVQYCSILFNIVLLWSFEWKLKGAPIDHRSLFNNIRLVLVQCMMWMKRFKSLRKDPKSLSLKDRGKQFVSHTILITIICIQSSLLSRIEWTTNNIDTDTSVVSLYEPVMDQKPSPGDHEIQSSIGREAPAYSFGSSHRTGMTVLYTSLQHATVFFKTLTLINHFQPQAHPLSIHQVPNITPMSQTLRIGMWMSFLDGRIELISRRRSGLSATRWHKQRIMAFTLLDQHSTIQRSSILHRGYFS